MTNHGNPLGGNPLGVAGLEFVEFAARDPQALHHLFLQLGFQPVARHLSKAVTLYRQRELRFLINAEPDSFASRFADEFGDGVCAIGIRVQDAQAAFSRAHEFGAWSFEGEKVGAAELVIPAIQGIGKSHIYFVDRWRGKPGAAPAETRRGIFDIDFTPLTPADAGTEAGALGAGTGLREVDHFTQSVARGTLQSWLDFYRDALHFTEIHQAHWDWPVAADARVMVSPCGAIRIPVYEEGDARTEQMHQFLSEPRLDGVQHIAMATDDIFTTVDTLLQRGVVFVAPPAAYYRELTARLPRHGLDVDALAARSILVDGAMSAEGAPRLFLQAFLKPAAGAMAFEIVERRGHPGFGEGNLVALARARASA